MLSRCFVLLSICVSLLIPRQTFAQKSESDTINDHKPSSYKIDTIQKPSKDVRSPRTSLYIELLGKGFLSLNVDYRWKESYAISFGLQPLEGLLTDFMFYHFGGIRRRFELGGGFSGGFSKDYELKVILLHGVIGYRSQKKKGLIFRAGFTPLYVIFVDEKDKNRSNKFYPFVGLSWGYSF